MTFLASAGLCNTAVWSNVEKWLFADDGVTSITPFSFSCAHWRVSTFRIFTISH
jgi:hypothetical protein